MMANEQLRRLIRETARGDQRGFKALYEATSGQLFGIAMKMLRDRALAEDVLQDAYVQVWHRAGEYHADRGAVLTWLTTIVRYRAIDLMRRRGKGPALLPPLDTQSLNADDGDRLARFSGESDDSQGPMAAAIVSEDSQRIRRCMGRLSDTQQRSVYLAFFRGLTHVELAQCLAEPLGTIKARLRRSLIKLRECLARNGEAHELLG